MLDQTDLARARDAVREFTKKELTLPLVFAGEGENGIKHENGVYTVTAADFPSLCRALSELTKVQEGLCDSPVLGRPFFEKSGGMLDCSRNAVATPETLRRLIRFSAVCGLNLLMLYTEDVYEIPEQPYFGYMRGRYSLAELKALNEYAVSYGIELVPCIQTLGHLHTFLTYNGEEIRDTVNTLLADEEKTYEFIEQAIRACRYAFSSSRIHVGMDEAMDLGTGQYLDKHGPCDRHEVLCRHLDRVRGICRKYGFEPMMWSDLFFCFASPSKSYYDVNTHFEHPETIPDVSMVYWDYYHEDQSFFDKMLACHQQMGKEVWFAGGASCWYALTPRFTAAKESTKAGLAACRDRGVKNVFMTMWGDDGNDCHLSFTLPYLALYGEYRWRGTDESWDAACRLLCGYGLDGAEAIGSLDMRVDNKDWNTFLVKRLLQTDPLYLFGMEDRHLCLARDYYDKCLQRIRTLTVREDAQDDADFAFLCFQTVSDKLDLVLTLRPAYEKGDRDALKKIADELLPRLAQKYDELEKNLRRRWMTTYKPFGYELHTYRYGGTIRRLGQIREKLNEYLSGETSAIPELEEKLLPTPGRRYYQAVVSAYAGG